MDFLQISYGDQILERMKYVESVLKSLADDDRYFLIADKNLLTDSRVNWIPAGDYESLMQQQDSRAGKLLSKNVTLENKADAIRVHYCLQNPNIVYLDTDILLIPQTNQVIKKIRWQFYEAATIKDLQCISNNNNGKVCFGAHSRGQIDDGIIYNSSSLEYFRKWYEWMLEYREPISHGWYIKYFTYHGGILPILVTGFYEHCYRIAPCRRMEQ